MQNSFFEVRDIWPFLTLMEEGGYSKYNPAVLGLGLRKIRL